MPDKKNPSVDQYVDYANKQIDEQAILDKYNAATIAQYNVQREQNRQNENQFYNQMYNTQKTAMDTIRNNNAAAVANGASRGVQAANELSALLGMQQESVQGATELAQANRQTAQEETAAVLENVLKAYQQAQQEKAQLVQQGIEASSVDTQQAATESQERVANNEALQKAAETGLSNYIAELARQGKDYTGDYSTEGYQSLMQALDTLQEVNKDAINSSWERFWHSDGSPEAARQSKNIESEFKTIIKAYGLDEKKYAPLLKEMHKPFTINSTASKDKLLKDWNDNYNTIIDNIEKDYLNKEASKKA